MKVVAIIQSRMGSTRLPGKVLKKVLGSPLLVYELERISRSKYIDEFVVATTDQSKDEPIVSLCEFMQIPFYRGSENDVLKRYYQTATAFNADVVVRLTSDCPLIDPEQIDRVIEDYFIYDYDLQYVSNVLKRTFPRGMDTEVFSLQALKKAYEKAVSKEDREHVTRYIINHPEIFKIFNVAHSKNYSYHRWTVDTYEDFTLIKKIIETLYPHNPHFSMEDIIHLLDKNPKWQLINKHIQQKKD
ncbi:glycosyltransferase family protein [Gracilibacillus sp. YIM 98692]|uniref:cytidylyltransferase domain-containing protein n=1 Tax=Gracilibacillus sp. YIM 98692 TaxID=2663532 RepID=UPI0013CFA45B|nr:glycosyltransferase family protein [Gracilibacillus sp. YIM 98692]